MADPDPSVLERCWSRAPGVDAVTLDGEAVLYQSPHGRLHVLNTSATLVWECLDGTVTGAELSDELAQAFGVDRDTMTAQVDSVLETFYSEGLIVPT